MHRYHYGARGTRSIAEPQNGYLGSPAAKRSCVAVHSKPLIELILAVSLASAKWAPVRARVNRRGETNDGHVHELILVIVKMLETYLIGA